MQREEVLEHALHVLEREGIASTTLEMVAKEADYPLAEVRQFWPDSEALLYDALRYLSSQVDVWRRQLMLDEEMTPEQKLLKRYHALTECVSNQRYPGCLFIAACTFYPDAAHPIHQLADQQKKSGLGVHSRAADADGSGRPNHGCPPNGVGAGRLPEQAIGEAQPGRYRHCQNPCGRIFCVLRCAAPAGH
ncbi:HTH-type transcriptional regulator yjdC [Cedecea neteri]|uniref:HTH-type transcriptional regulator yjdC n=1 Tax=Cedecea neteri TaxID=158822 RepID=A0A2X2V866_9ENTR|nr:HTH-type transcriptional regulator yjdC [Cedecea neteri]